MHTSENDDRSPPLVLRLDAGPDARRTIAIAGSVVLGRAAGPGRIVDPFLEPHHLLLRTSDRRVVQLSGRAPARVDGVVVGSGAAIRIGSVIEVGATRIVIAEPGSAAGTPHQPPPGTVVLGIGIRRHDPDAVSLACHSFARLAAIEHERHMGAITLDLDAIRRILVTGPSADGLIRSLVAQADRHRIHVADRTASIGARPPSGRVVVVADPDPDAAWPGDEIPSDGAVVSVGVSWEAVLMLRSPDGSSRVQRFRAAGHPGGSRSDRALVAQEVARAGAELGGDVVGVPQPARRERETAASDALVELVAHPGEQRDLLVEAGSP